MKTYPISFSSTSISEHDESEIEQGASTMFRKCISLDSKTDQNSPEKDPQHT